MSTGTKYEATFLKTKERVENNRKGSRERQIEKINFELERETQSPNVRELHERELRRKMKFARLVIITTLKGRWR